MSNIKLIYFDLKGRAEVSRLIMAAGGKKYEDVRYKQGEWDAGAKDKTPFKQAPTLEVDGVTYGQSLAIARYLAKECGLYGSSNLEQLVIDQWVDLGSDLLSKAIPAFMEKDEAKKAELWKDFTEKSAPQIFTFYENGLTSSGFFTSQMTLADIAVYDLVTGTIMERMPSLDKYPKLKAMCAKVEANPGIKAWVDKRK